MKLSIMNTLFRIPKLLTLVFIVFFTHNTLAQSTTGMSGLVKAPNARMYEQGTLAIGASLIPPGYHKRTYGQLKGKLVGNAGLNTFVTATLFPFMEVMFRYSHELNLEVTPETEYFPDRMMAARFKLLNEKEKWPAIVAGFHDVTGAVGFDQGGSPNFSSTYLVGSKLFHYKNFQIDASLGYGFAFRGVPAKDFDGMFAGVAITTPYIKDAQFLLDYDATYINLGIQKYFLKRIHTMVNFYPNYKKFGWVIAYRYPL